ncbi:nucleoid-associated protein [Clostridium baratii]|uniref:nucleoid-associated protein n=1 Tax=Clostridium baratii TaxID=1561 RepID=UPI00097FB123|nr:hypothetical protein [Clostridium baratii]AQM58918.1 hypothetical protein NPD11_403 [Clostridium baratii]
MKIRLFEIEDIVIHEIFKRDKDKNIVQPRYSDELSILDNSGLDTLKVRILNAIGASSNSVEMDISDTSQTSCIKIIDDINSDDTDSLTDDEKEKNYIENSKRIAYKLAESQKTIKIPGGIVVVLKGTFNKEKKKFVCIIKAEIQNGFTRNNKNTLEFISELLLTPQQKFYKIAFWYENDKNAKDLKDKYNLLIYDNNMKKSETKDAAIYFYETFLGSTFKKNSKIVTRDFYNETKEFINSLNVSDDEKFDLNMKLYLYVKSDLNTTISVDEFSTENLPVDLRDLYKNTMKRKSISEIAFTKDTEYLNKKMKKTKINFTNNISITGLTEQIDDQVKVIKSKEEVEFSEDITVLMICGKISDLQ